MKYTTIYCKQIKYMLEYIICMAFVHKWWKVDRNNALICINWKPQMEYFNVRFIFSESNLPKNYEWTRPNQTSAVNSTRCSAINLWTEFRWTVDIFMTQDEEGWRSSCRRDYSSRDNLFDFVFCISSGEGSIGVDMVSRGCFLGGWSMGNQG